MGTPFGTESILENYSNLIQQMSYALVKVLEKNYFEGNLDLGENISDTFLEREVFYTLVDSESENVFLNLKLKNTEHGNAFEIEVRERGNDSSSLLTISVNNDLMDMLPNEMIEKLQNKLFEFFD